MRKGAKGLFLPELVDRKPRPWKKNVVEIRAAAVDLTHAEAWVPEAYTPAQRLARLHELAHVKWTPHNWRRVALRVMEGVGEGADYKACLKISKMLEENRIDWMLWDRRGIDLRPAREALDWALMPDPDDLLRATGIVMQLAWTVWASRGLGKGIPNEPPVRVPDPATGEYFDKAWKLVADEDHDLAVAIIRGCLRMYHDPRNATRDAVAVEIASYFKIDEEQEPEAPPDKPEEKQAQEEAKKQEAEQEKKEEELETGAAGDVASEGRVEYHDHTASLRRQNMRIVRRMVPVPQGIHLRYAHRYLIDKAVFGQRMLTEGGIMIDGSGSMAWTDADMRLLVERLPAVTVGVYSGWDSRDLVGDGPIGRICTIAKAGRFSKFVGRDPGVGSGNAVDLEALRLLARWPKPRLWLSDGMVCGGMHTGPCEHPEHRMGWYEFDGKLHEACSTFMKAHEILRVPNREVMAELLGRKRVTLYRTTRPDPSEHVQGSRGYGWYTENWPSDVHPEPTTFQL